MTNNIEETTDMQTNTTIPIYHDELERNWQEMEIRGRQKREKLTPTHAETYSHLNDPDVQIYQERRFGDTCREQYEMDWFDKTPTTTAELG